MLVLDPLPPHFFTMDPNDLSNLSEVESLSDSDWLDISSRASEDNDSLVDSDVSDREDLASDYRPPSRRSLASHASSREGEIQGWEGIVEDSSDEALPPSLHVDAGDRTLRIPRQSFRTVALSEAAIAQHTASEDPEEEKRVKDALDQSMVSTLSASRSNSLNASVQTSIVHPRDLRLSFPDPLTSSSPHAHSLNPSYEDITADMTYSDRDAHSSTEMVAETALAAADPGSTTMPVVARDDACKEVSLDPIINFYIVLYGASSAIKHRVVQRVLEKLMAATSCGFTSLPPFVEPQNIWSMRMVLNRGRETHSIISIVDRTDTVLCGKEVGHAPLSSGNLTSSIFSRASSLCQTGLR